MIVVSVGNAHQPFRRLLDAVAVAVDKDVFGREPVLVQAGHTPFAAPGCTVVDFLEMEEFIEAVRGASLVICHGGAGTLHHAFAFGKTPVVMPRRVKYGEHMDDQYELVRALAEADRVIPAYEPDDLPDAIRRGLTRQTETHGDAAPEPALIRIIAELLDDLLQPASPV